MAVGNLGFTQTVDENNRVTSGLVIRNQSSHVRDITEEDLLSIQKSNTELFNERTIQGRKLEAESIKLKNEEKEQAMHRILSALDLDKEASRDLKLLLGET